MKKLNTIWRKDGLRQRPGKFEDSRWIKKGGKWRYVTDQVTDGEWLARRRESMGWFRGARVQGKAA